MAVQSIDPVDIQKNPNITMTEKAILHFNKQRAESEKKGVRLFITRSGCSGYMYRVELVYGPEDGDITVSITDDFSLYVEGESLAILQGTEIDFKRDGFNEILMFNNPNVTGECGCGESFVVEAETQKEDG